MKKQTLYIRNMVCPRCILTVQNLLHQQGIDYATVRLGEVDLPALPAPTALQAFSQALEDVGFELLDDQKKQQIEKIKTLLIQKVQEGEIEDHFSISKFLAAEMHRDYSHISKLFSEVEGITLEQFFILQKIEKVKEWLVYNELSVNDIAFSLGYSSVQHLSSQFKKITGMTPSHFRKMGSHQRKPLDNLSA